LLFSVIAFFPCFAVNQSVKETAALGPLDAQAAPISESPDSVPMLSIQDLRFGGPSRRHCISGSDAKYT
jgi:hypothetical protein